MAVAEVIIPPPTTPLQRSERGLYWLHVRPSVRPSVCLSVRPSVDGTVSTLYLQQYLLGPVHIYTSYQERQKVCRM